MFIDPIVPDEVPVLPPPSLSFVKEREARGEEVGVKGLPKKETPRPREGSLRLQASEIPKESRALFGDWNIRLFMLDLFGLTSRACRELGEKGAIPYLSLLAAPTYLAHSSKKAYARFQVMHDAIAVGKTADAYFWGAKGADSTMTAINVFGKSLNGVAVLAGAIEKAIVAMIFTFVLPILLIVIGAIGGTSMALSLARNAKALKAFDEKSKHAKSDLRAIVKTLDYLQGPMHNVSLEDRHSDSAAQRSLRVEHKNFKDNHFTNATRFKKMQERIEKFQLASKIKNAPEKLKNIPGWEDLFQLVRGVEGLYQELLLSKYGDETELVERLISLYEKLEMSPLNHNETLLKMIRENKEELLSLKREGHEIIELAHSEMHRVLFYNALFLLMAVMILTDGMLVLALPGHSFIHGGLTIAATILEISYLIFDKKVDEEQFLALERFLKIMPENPLAE